MKIQFMLDEQDEPWGYMATVETDADRAELRALVQKAKESVEQSGPLLIEGAKS